MQPPEQRRPATDAARAAEWRAAMERGKALYRAGRYREATGIFQSIFTGAQASSPDLAARALGNLGAISFANHQYKQALDRFRQARQLSGSAGDAPAVAIWDANIASLYFELGDVNTAAEWANLSLEHLHGPERTEKLPKLQIELASLRALQGRMPEARQLFAQGIEGADRMGDINLYATGWHKLGSILLERGDLAGAEAALLEAYRTGKLHHLPLGRSEEHTSELQSHSDLVCRLLLEKKKKKK